MAMFMHAFLIAGLWVVGSDASYAAANQTFEGYVQVFGKNYAKSSTEYGMRESLFNARVAEILQHNARGLSWQMGLNDFTDWTDAELQSLRGFKRPHKGDASLGGSSVMELGDRSCSSKAQSCSNAVSCCGGLICGANAVCEKPAGLTDALDYSSVATAMDILNQGACGSCWAVAAAAAVQLQAAKLHPGFNKVLSPESINKCAPNPNACGGDGGCQGSTPELAFDYLKTEALSKGGLTAIDALPYTASTDSTGVPETDGDCASRSSSLSFLQVGNLRSSQRPVEQAVVGISDWIKVKANHAEDVMNALTTVGPLAVAIVGSGIQGYTSGVMSGCQSTVVDHAVLMMGYGTDPKSNMLYWNIRNSWGKSWGENGFFRLRRHYAPGVSKITGNPDSDADFQGEPCADDMDPAKGVACKDAVTHKYPEKTRVCGECGIVSDVAYPTGLTVDPRLLV